jgi:hypothetical protein
MRTLFKEYFYVARMAKIRHFVAEMNGGKHVGSRPIANFTPQKTAARTGAATVAA